jgi:hypothetical protein
MCKKLTHLGMGPYTDDAARAFSAGDGSPRVLPAAIRCDGKRSEIPRGRTSLRCDQLTNTRRGALGGCTTSLNARRFRARHRAVPVTLGLHISTKTRRSGRAYQMILSLRLFQVAVTSSPGEQALARFVFQRAPLLTQDVEQFGAGHAVLTPLSAHMTCEERARSCAGLLEASLSRSSCCLDTLRYRRPSRLGTEAESVACA